ncbi:MAG: acetylglutamate kinase [Peptococcaceae bacterium]|nr:acetylglutamate kinase [Peptococcaceae bacterium]
MVLTALEKAGILVEALPYIKEFYGKTVVIKYGGHAMVNCELKKAVMTDVVLMKFVGMHPVIVHGGGPEISKMLKKLGKESRFVNGLRVTDRETMEIVEMVLVGKINKEIVSMINSLGGKAIGLSGKDANLFEAVKKLGQVPQPDGGEEQVDIGFVGEVTKVNPDIVSTVFEKGYIPVVAPIAAGSDGESYNINADLVAGKLASALKAHKLVILTDVEGIMQDPADKNSLISVLPSSDVPALKAKGIISGGMIPKVDCCVDALRGGVNQAHILDGRVPHSVLLEIFTDQGVGTMVVP